MKKHACRKIAALLSAAVFFTVGASAAAPESPVLLSWTDDPATSMTFTWRDVEQSSEYVQIVPQTQYDRSGFTDALEFAAACKDISLDGSGVWHYEAEAADLEPGTAYAYRVGSENRWSEQGTFTTAEENITFLTFAYLGDPQTNNDTAGDYALWGDLLEAIVQRNPELAFAVLGGDDVNSGISLEEFRLFTENAGRVFSSIPLFSTVGNHESNFIGGKPELFLDWFAFPKNGPEGFEEEFYSFDVASCHVLVLNSWIYSGEQPLTDEDYARVNAWIAADLATSAANWQVVVTHVPVYAVHSDTTAVKIKEAWAPIFEQYGVDLVFVGHQHVYSRSYPLYQGKVDYENGITYIMGVSGSKFYDSADETLAERTVYNDATYQLVQIDGNMLTVQTMDLEGTELDYVSIPQRDVSVTRREYINTLWKNAGSPAPRGDTPFIDTNDPAVVWAYEAGIVLGCGGGIFMPDANITPWQIDLVLERMEG